MNIPCILQRSVTYWNPHKEHIDLFRPEELPFLPTVGFEFRGTFPLGVVESVWWCLARQACIVTLSDIKWSLEHDAVLAVVSQLKNGWWLDLSDSSAPGKRPIWIDTDQQWASPVEMKCLTAVGVAFSFRPPEDQPDPNA